MNPNMAKITIAQVKKALPTIKPGLEIYICLREKIYEDVSKDPQFQKKYTGFFGIRRNNTFRTEYLFSFTVYMISRLFIA